MNRSSVKNNKQVRACHRWGRHAWACVLDDYRRINERDKKKELAKRHFRARFLTLYAEHPLED